MASKDNSRPDRSAAARDFDRTQLGEKTRVFQLAKQLGLPSKDLVVALNELGLVKVAQSTLTKAEAEQLLDALAAAPADDGDEKIRRRVRKDVENEINQIEEKVDAELANEEPLATEEPLTNVEPEVTPAPQTRGSSSHAPLFKPPARAERRRASRPADGSSQEATREGGVDTQGEDTDDTDDIEVIDEPRGIKGSARLEAQRRRRSERREEGRKRSRIVSQAEFLARRESVTRTMVVRERDRHDGHGRITQVGVLEDGLLVEHFVTSEQHASLIGNIYLGRVQNVLPSMEAAFIDIGQGRNGVLYAGEVDWKAAGLGGRSRRIEQALKSGDQVVVQVTKDPVGHKGARLSTQISLAGRYLVYVPGGRSAGISRKLPAPERKRLKEILGRVVPGKGGAIIRTAAENVPEDAIAADVNRLHAQWEAIQEKAEQEKSSKGAKPVTLYEEPNLLVKVIRDLFNDDFTELVVDGKRPWNVVHAYVSNVAADLEDRLVKYDRSEHGGADAFETYRIDEQIQKALSRTVWLPSGGTLVIDKTEAMTVIDVNTGKFTGSGGSLEETVTRNNLEAAEEIVRQMRLRDLGGMIIVDFIDMILPENQELVLRRLKEALGRDRTRHQVSEVTSLGLVQMTRKRLGTGLLETFSTPCETCGGRGILLSEDPVDDEQQAEEVREKAHAGQEEPKGTNDNDNDGASTNARERRDIAVDDDALRKLADSVVGGVVSDDEAEEESPSRGRRRGRRGGSRGRGRGRGEDAEQPTKGEQADQKPATPATKPAAKSYEEAVKEFESSPRRKRSTRGNSRSDHAPRREDFEGDGGSAEGTDSGASGKDAAPAHARGSAEAPRRGRRRAVRRSRSTATEQQPAQQEKQEKPEEREPASQGAPAGGGAAKKKQQQRAGGSSGPRGRGRRRATRKRTS
ncbi:translation initiation factor IF-2 N-terminal domain-containing protein [Corynebacterium timonense]|uniref:translation initiation factor IF-2 N-terminal domain-containing protein n=1 Tax=Corynebacterium timonense TaxID=441500 RepID=UPI00031B3048|nr:translation initiation factor IF-2 N-terminal domain-containing protein [Corynebacterium timonense]